VTITPKQFTFLMMTITTAMKWAFRKVGELTEEELDVMIADEERRTEELTSQLDG